MKGYRFDPSRLARSPTQLERDGYATAARLLREYLGGLDLWTVTAPRPPRRPGTASRRGCSAGPRPRLDSGDGGPGRQDGQQTVTGVAPILDPLSHLVGARRRP